MKKKTTYEIGIMMKPVKGFKDWQPIIVVTRNYFTEITYLKTLGM